MYISPVVNYLYSSKMLNMHIWADAELKLLEIESLQGIIKEIVERRHGEPIKFLFLPKMGLLGSQAGNEKNCWLWIMSNFLGLFNHVFMGKNSIFKQKISKNKFLPMKTWKNSPKKLLRIHNQQFFSLPAWLPKRPIFGKNRNLIGSLCLLSTISLIVLHNKLKFA